MIHRLSEDTDSALLIGGVQGLEDQEFWTTAGVNTAFALGGAAVGGAVERVAKMLGLVEDSWVGAAIRMLLSLSCKPPRANPRRRGAFQAPCR
jgi:hypothetical protein